jgi:hypothetical protein
MESDGFIEFRNCVKIKNLFYMKKNIPISLKAIFYILLLHFIFPFLVRSATYYVDATAGNDTNSGISLNTSWKTIAKVNSTRFNPGDQILFKKAEVWREQLIISSSGSPGNPILFGAYGNGNNPIINGADIINNWTLENESNTYYSIIPAEPNQVFKNEIRMAKSTSRENMDPNSWYWDNNNKKLYIKTPLGVNPSGSIIEASQRGNNIFINGKDYLIIGYLSSKYSNESGMDFYGGSNNIEINNCILSYNYRHGIKVWTDIGIEQNITISACDISYNWKCGIGLSSNCSNWKITGNSIHHNAQGNIVDSAGIYIFGISVNNITTEYNSVYSNGVGIDNESGYGIWYDTVGSGGIIRYNSIYDNSKSGIQVEQCTGVEVYYNIIYNNRQIQVLLSRGIHSNKIYNNVSYGGQIGFMVKGDSSLVKDDVTEQSIKNNIVFGYSEKALIARYGGENDGVWGHGNVYANNCFGPESMNFIEWGEKVYKSTYPISDTGEISNWIKSNPLFVNALAADFRLMSTSPCINKGTDVNITKDYAGSSVPQSGTPDIGAYEYREVLPPSDLRKVIKPSP